MKLNGYHLLLPEGTLDYFDLVDVKESMNEVIIYLEEKNQLPSRSMLVKKQRVKGFMSLLLFKTFLFVARKSFLNLRRRRWILKSSNEYISRNWRMVAEGTRLTQDFASFLKRTILIIIRSVASYWVLYMALTGICWNVNTATI